MAVRSRGQQIKGSEYLIIETFSECTNCTDCSGYSIILLICRCVFCILKKHLNLFQGYFNQVHCPFDSIDHEIVVKIEVSPINPSDMWLMFGPANLSKASLSDNKSILTALLYPGILSRIKRRSMC
jgi:hypothetical protein